jgi:hypothetical protein
MLLLCQRGCLMSCTRAGYRFPLKTERARNHTVGVLWRRQWLLIRLEAMWCPWILVRIRRMLLLLNVLLSGDWPVGEILRRGLTRSRLGSVGRRRAVVGHGG